MNLIGRKKNSIIFSAKGVYSIENVSGDYYFLTFSHLSKAIYFFCLLTFPIKDL